jgi:hypothetical protein
MASSHENFSRDEKLKPGSNRGFGLVIGAAFLVLAVVKGWTGSWWWPMFAGTSAAFFAAAWLTPSLLTPLNHLWFRFGLLLHRIVSPLLMGLIYFGAVVPIGLLMRLLGQRPIAPGFDPDAKSYWVSRADPTQPPGSMAKQY